MIPSSLFPKVAILTALAQSWEASARGDATNNATGPITMPLFVTGAPLYDTFQMTVGLGTPSKTPSVVFCSLASAFSARV